MRRKTLRVRSVRTFSGDDKLSVSETSIKESNAESKVINAQGSSILGSGSVEF